MRCSRSMCLHVYMVQKAISMHTTTGKPLKTEEPLLDWIHSGSWCKSTQKGRTDKNKGIFEIYVKFSVDLCTVVKLHGAPIFSKRALKMPTRWKLVQNSDCLHSGFYIRRNSTVEIPSFFREKTMRFENNIYINKIQS